ncbi:MAG: aminotransferase class I/II-fold pyridoxal phosphate-dependent enzyme [Pseudomonadota bacterium]
MADDPPALRPESRVVHPSPPNPTSGAVMPGIEVSTTFARDEQYDLLNRHHAYIRDENPTFRLAETVLTELEHGSDTLLFSSGMAAGMAIVQALAPGDQIVVPEVMYWSLRNWMEDFSAKWGIGLVKFDGSDPGAAPQALADALANPTTGARRVVWLESPANPVWNLIDIEACARVAHGKGAIVVCDATAATPVLTRPLDLGADIVMHSATKYLNGHSDVLAGALITREKTPFWRLVKRARAENGAILGSFEAWLLQRGMRTLFLRVRAASANALQIARHFESHPRVERVLYPGLPSHPGHEIALRQMHGGFGGMLSLLVKGGADAALATIGRCKLFVRATSIGGVESLIEHRPTIEGPRSPIPQNLLRISVGIEAVEDLIADLEQALD